MTGRDLRLALVATTEDRGATEKLRQINRAVERETERTGRRSVQVADQTAQAQERAATRGRTAAERMAQDRERLGIRSETRIRREISLTESAYDRLARSGRLSANEQGRAFASMQQRVQALRQEMHSTTQQQSRFMSGFSLASRGMQAYQAVAGGVVAGGYMIAQPLSRTMSYDRRLAEMSNTAFAERDLAGRQRGMGELDAAIRNAVRVGGGSQDQAASALDTMIAAGALSQADAIRLLPTIQKNAVATGADPIDLAKTANRMPAFGIPVAEVPRALDIAIKGGQEGGFELKDMARWLPQQMAAARSLGMHGLKDFASLVAVNQGAMITAGTTDEGGNNVVNWVAKLASKEFANTAKKVEISPGKGIDVTGTFSAALEKGINPLYASLGIVNRIMANNKEYQKLQGRIQTTTDKGERDALLQAKADLLQGSVVSELFPDRQALMGMLGTLNNVDYVKRVDRVAYSESAGTGETNHQLIASTPSYQVERAKNEALFAEQDGFKGLAGTVGEVAGKLADYGEKYPALAQALVTTTHSLNALAAAAAAATVVGMLRGGAGAAAASRAAAGAAGAAGAARGMGVGGLMARGSGAVALGVGAKEVWDIQQSDMPADEKAQATTQAVVGAGGGFGGAMAGAKAGAVFGPWGAAAGALGGGLLGGFLGDELGEFLGKHIFKREAGGGSEAYPTLTGGFADVRSAMEAVRGEPREVKITVDVKNGNIVAAVNEENARQARRH